MVEPSFRAALAAALEFQRQSGVDLALDLRPHDRYAESAAEAARGAQPRASVAALAPAPPLPTPISESASTSGSRVVRAPAGIAAREGRPRHDDPHAPPRGAQPALAADAAEIAACAAEQAAGAATLDDLRARLEAFDGCALKASATRLVFEDGDRRARVAFVGEAPGADEDREGRPFVGRAGQLLDRMLASVGLDRRRVYIMNVVPWRPPGNRTPTPQETAACLPFTRRQIALVDPDIVVCLGASSMQALLGVREGILKTRGRWLSYAGVRTVPAMAMLHPAYLLRQPVQKRLAWRDLQAMKDGLERESGPMDAQQG